MQTDIRDKIIKAWNQFENKHRNTQPTKLYLTIEDEREVLKLLPEISESLAQDAFKKGVRIAVPKIFGFEVVYRAKKFRFE
jgi:hypothetical protein